MLLNHRLTCSNQSVPFEDVDLLAADVPLQEALEREGGGLGRRPGARLRRRGGLGRGAGARPPRRAQRAAAAHPRPLRPPARPGRAGPELALAAARRGRARDPRAPVARPAAGRARRPRRARAAVDAGQRRRDLPGLDDLQRGAGAARGPGARGRVGAAADAARLRARRALRDGDDREAGRLGRAREHHARRVRRATAGGSSPATSGSAPIRRATLFLVLAQAPGRPLLLRARARPGDGVPAPQGQARHALAALERGRVPRRRRAHARRGGPRGGDDHRDGHPHAAGLRDRLGGRDAPRRGRGGLARAPPQRLRRAAVRAAADAQRARRPRARVRGRDGDRAAARALLRRGRRDVPALRDRGPEVLDLQARDPARRGGARVPGRQRLRRGVARCRGCCATRR